MSSPVKPLVPGPSSSRTDSQSSSEDVSEVAHIWNTSNTVPYYLPQYPQHDHYLSPYGISPPYSTGSSEGLIYSKSNSDYSWQASLGASLVTGDQASYGHDEMSYHPTGHTSGVPSQSESLHRSGVGHQRFLNSSGFSAANMTQSFPAPHFSAYGNHPDLDGPTTGHADVVESSSYPYFPQDNHNRISAHSSSGATAGIPAESVFTSQPEPNVPRQNVSADPLELSSKLCEWDNCGQQLSDVTVRGVREHLRQCHFRNRSPPLSAKELMPCRWSQSCGSDTMQWENLPKHIAEVHLKSMTRPCEDCGGWFARGDTLRRHRDSGGCIQGRRATFRN